MFKKTIKITNFYVEIICLKFKKKKFNYFEYIQCCF